MTDPTTDQVLRDNQHFIPDYHVDSRSDAERCDSWAFERGYTSVVTYRSGNYLATYGYYTPSREWHLWAN